MWVWVGVKQPPFVGSVSVSGGEATASDHCLKMAEHAAHLTSATDVDRPSVFEVLAQDNLMMTIRPAGKHAVRVIVCSDVK